MYSHIDKIVRDKENNRVILTGWAVDGEEEPAQIKVLETSNVKKERLTRKPRPDVEEMGLGIGDAGFIYEVFLDDFSGKLPIQITAKGEQNQILLDLDKAFSHPAEVTSPLNILKREAKRQLRRGKNLLHIASPAIHESNAFYEADREPYYKQWIHSYETAFDEERAKEKSLSFAGEASFDILSIQDTDDESKIVSFMESVGSSIYTNWELYVAIPSSCKNRVEKSVKNSKALEPYKSQIHLIPVSGNDQGKNQIVKNAALGFDKGWVILCDSRGVLTKRTLFHTAEEITDHKDLNMIYADDDVLEFGERKNPYFKSDYAPDSILVDNYIGGYLAVRRTLFEDTLETSVNFFSREWIYDFFLNAEEKAEKNTIGHIPKVLSHLSTRDKDLDAMKESVRGALRRRGRNAEIIDHDYGYNVLFGIEGSPKVSVIIPTKDNPDVLKRCVLSILDRTDYKNYEIVIANNNSVKEETMKVFDELEKTSDKVKVVPVMIPFNYSRVNNLAVKESDGDYLLFLNDDTEVLSPGWMSSMLGFAQHPETGAVGAKLLYENGTVQHAGVVLGIGGIAGHIHYHLHPDQPGYFGKLCSTTNFSCVTAACLMVARKKFEEVGGFDENIAVAYNDVELCAALAEHGYYNVYDPMAVLTHFESISRGYDSHSNIKFKRQMSEKRKVVRKWPEIIEYDPMYNPNLDTNTAFFLPKI